MAEPPGKPVKIGKPTINAWAYGEVGFEFAVAVALFAGLGWLLDRWLGTLPWLTVLGTALGFMVGMYRLLKIARDLRKT